MASDPTYGTKNYEAQGGALWVVGGTLDVSGGTLKVPAGTAGFKALAGAGVAAPGPITLTGAAVGDRVVAAFGAPTAGGTLAALVVGTDVESTISVVNQIQQLSASDLHLNTYVFILNPA